MRSTRKQLGACHQEKLLRLFFLGESLLPSFSITLSEKGSRPWKRSGKKDVLGVGESGVPPRCNPSVWERLVNTARRRKPSQTTGTKIEPVVQVFTRVFQLCKMYRIGDLCEKMRLLVCSVNCSFKENTSAQIYLHFSLC